MNREQVFLAVLSGVVSRGPKFKRREPGQCGPAEVDYNKMIMITNNVTDAVMMRSVDIDVKQDSRPTWGETQRLLVELESVQAIAEQHRITAMRLQAEVDRIKEQIKSDMENDRDLAAKLNRELSESRTNFSEAYKKIEAKEVKILELEEEIKRLERELQASNQALAAAGTRPTWHHLREVEAKLRDAMMKCAAFDKECQNKDADLCRLQDDKDALRKAVEDGAMEIERLTNTLKGVEQIVAMNVAMKPEDVEALKAAWEKIEKDGGLITMKWSNDAMAMIHQDESRPLPQTFRPLPQTKVKTWGNDCGTLPVAATFINGELYSVSPVSDPVVNIKNDLSSAVANSTEGQRVVVEDLEATVGLDPGEWVILDREVYGEHVLREGVDQWQFGTFEDEWTMADGSCKRSGTRYKDRSKGSSFHVRCRRKDIPVVEVNDARVSSVAAAEDPEEYVLITDPTHKLRACDDYCSDRIMIVNGPEYLQYQGGGWISCFGSTVGKPISAYENLVYRCKRKDLPVAPPADESQS